MGAVDHECQRPPAAQPDPPVERAHRGRRRVVAEVEVAELGAEVPHERRAELLVLVGAVLHDDDLVARPVDALLVGRVSEWRVRGASRRML